MADAQALESPQEFVNAWSDYLDALQQAVQAKLDRLEDANFLAAFSDLYTDVFQLLQSAELRRSLEVAITAALDEADGPEAVEFLMREILTYTQWQRPTAAPADNTRVARRRPVEVNADADKDAEAGPDAVGAGQTIKESLENLLKGKISRRFSKVLKVLNELLSIVRGG